MGFIWFGTDNINIRWVDLVTVPPLCLLLYILKHSGKVECHHTSSSIHFVFPPFSAPLRNQTFCINSWLCIFCVLANTRVIKQSSLQKFQEEMEAVQKDPYRVVMKQTKVPMSLLHDRVRAHVSLRGSVAESIGAFDFSPVFLTEKSPCRSYEMVFIYF